MRTSSLLRLVVVGSAVFWCQAPARADMPALAGLVTAAEDGALEGVLVSAKRAGSTITVTVVSDTTGHYSFPAAKLAPGQYAVTIRAVGYELEAPGAVDVAAQKTTAA